MQSLDQSAVVCLFETVPLQYLRTMLKEDLVKPYLSFMHSAARHKMLHVQSLKHEWNRFPSALAVWSLRLAQCVLSADYQLIRITHWIVLIKCLWIIYHKGSPLVHSVYLRLSLDRQDSMIAARIALSIPPVCHMQRC